jgi:uncharacterized protein YjbI with pentapeptide repeats
MDREELIRKYSGKEKDFTGRDFRSADCYEKIFRGIYREANFANARFDGCSFEESDLSFAKFTNVYLTHTTFNGCFMKGVDFSYAYFGQAGIYEGANLRGAIFKGANFIEGSIHDADLSYADLSGAKNLSVASCVNVIFHETIMPNGQIYTGRT